MSALEAVISVVLFALSTFGVIASYAYRSDLRGTREDIDQIRKRGHENANMLQAHAEQIARLDEHRDHVKDSLDGLRGDIKDLKELVQRMFRGWTPQGTPAAPRRE